MCLLHYSKGNPLDVPAYIIIGLNKVIAGSAQGKTDALTVRCTTHTHT